MAGIFLPPHGREDETHGGVCMDRYDLGGLAYSHVVYPERAAVGTAAASDHLDGADGGYAGHVLFPVPECAVGGAAAYDLQRMFPCPCVVQHPAAPGRNHLLPADMAGG